MSKSESKIEVISTNMLDLLHGLAENKSQIRGPMLSGIFDFLKSLTDKNAGKDYPLEKFSPFFWLANFAHVFPIHNGQKLTVGLSIYNVPLGMEGVYYINEHSVQVKPKAKQEPAPELKFELTPSGIALREVARPFKPGLNFAHMSRILMHELTHAMAGFLYPPMPDGTPHLTPPESKWGSDIGLALRASLLSPFVLTEEKESFFRFSLYQQEEYPREFIAETISYCIQFGELPFKGYMPPKDELQLTTAIDSFLEDCASSLQKHIAMSEMSMAFPWLRNWDCRSSSMKIPEQDTELFHLYMRGLSCWSVAWRTQDIAVIDKMLILDPNDFFKLYNIMPNCPFKNEIWDFIMSGGATTPLDNLIIFLPVAPPDEHLDIIPSAPPAEPLDIIPSAPPAVNIPDDKSNIDETAEATPDMPTDRPPPYNPNWRPATPTMDTSSSTSGAGFVTTNNARFTFTPTR